MKLSPALEHLPPQALDAEQGVLGLILEDPTPKLALAAGRLIGAGDFYRDEHGSIFRAAVDLAEAGSGTDILTVVAELKDRGQYDACGGREYLLVCIQSPAHSGQLPEYCRRIKEASLKRQIIATGGEVIGSAYNGAEPSFVARQAARLTALATGLARRAEDRDRSPVSAEKVMLMEFPEPVWAVPNLVPAGLSLVFGKPKVGKSWWNLQLGLAIAAGGKAFGAVDVQRRGVLYLALEDSLYRLQGRMRQLTEGDEAPSDLYLATEWPRWNEGGHPLLTGWLGDHPGVGVVVIDTLAKIRPSRDPRAQLYDEDYAAIGDMKHLADSLGLAVVITHHQRKGGAEDIFDTASGTLGLTGAADAMLVLTKTRNEQSATLHVTGREVRERELLMEWDDHAGWQLKGDAAEYARTQADREVLSVFERAAGPVNAEMLAAALDLKVGAAKKRLQRMAFRGLIAADPTGNGWYRLVTGEYKAN